MVKLTIYILSTFVKALYDFPNGSLLEHLLYQNPMISPTAHKATVRHLNYLLDVFQHVYTKMRPNIKGLNQLAPYTKYMGGLEFFLGDRGPFEDNEVWPAMLQR